MDLTAFLERLKSADNDAMVKDLCRRSILHGTPFVFQDREDEYYAFRKRISEKFEVHFHEVYIVGSAKLGFSPFKRTTFDLNSDIDVAIVSAAFYDRIFEEIWRFQMELRASRRSITTQEIEVYHSFLEYSALGWMRPDKLPFSFRVHALKTEWFDFFKSISNGRSEVGNYSVNAGVFKSFSYLERYTIDGIRNLRTSLLTQAT